jgi:hypothetical protein
VEAASFRHQCRNHWLLSLRHQNRETREQFQLRAPLGGHRPIAPARDSSFSSRALQAALNFL